MSDNMIKQEYPPNIEAIAEVLPKAKTTRGVMFAYDPYIYSPHTEDIPGEIIQHELCHMRQQRAVGGPDKWWARYLTDPDFRFQQELEAHVVEAQTLFSKSPKTRNDRRRISRYEAKRACAPLYGISNRKERDVAKYIMAQLKG